MKFFEQLTKLGEAMVEMPFVTVRAVLAPGHDGSAMQEIQQAGWKTYDAWVQVVNESTNSLYASPEVGSSMGRTMEASLRWQRLGSAMTDAFFAALWPAVGLPSAAELSELRAEVGALRDDLAAARLEAEEARAAEIALHDEHPLIDPLIAMWNGGWAPAAAAAPAPQRGEEDAPGN